mmetsp:Transcript_16648/g.47465  ORF Transcript_16648/g.47465 Transcript_16648/m.47465 type:complete len:201 (+) Transcript_16648:1230-1832(+)
MDRGHGRAAGAKLHSAELLQLGVGFRDDARRQRQALRGHGYAGADLAGQGLRPPASRECALGVREAGDPRGGAVPGCVGGDCEERPRLPQPRATEHIQRDLGLWSRRNSASCVHRDLGQVYHARREVLCPPHRGAAADEEQPRAAGHDHHLPPPPGPRPLRLAALRLPGGRRAPGRRRGIQQLAFHLRGDRRQEARDRRL